MSADRLREAARVLRERAEAATPGPWYAAKEFGHVIFSGTGSDDDVAVTEDFDVAADATYIATMNPTVGLTVADLLDRWAAHYEPIWQGPHVPWELAEALKVADAILAGVEG